MSEMQARKKPELSLRIFSVEVWAGGCQHAFVESQPAELAVQEAVRPDVALDQLGLDSLSLMEFVFAVEDRFDVRIPEDRLDPRQAGVTLEQLAVLLDEAIAAKASRDVVSG